jgi:hypothetical protein
MTMVQTRAKTWRPENRMTRNEAKRAKDDKSQAGSQHRTTHDISMSYHHGGLSPRDSALTCDVYGQVAAQAAWFFALWRHD